MTSKAFCVHGHFYQPPREDPLTGEIPLEPGAAPYSNWNERIYDHCYRPNAELGVFQQISFNIGPTLIEWMDQYQKVTLESVIRQDHHNFEKYGVGNAMAQAYHHTILPLASRLDKETQVKWGIADFEFRYGHKPAGMWLPETAVDIETLEILAENGISFTVLAPWQAQISNLDTSQPYRVPLPGGSSVVVFFYHQELSNQVSFDPGATVNADRFLTEMILPKLTFATRRLDQPQFLLIASDGELYGHHQPFRDKFLAFLTDGAADSKPIQVSFPALWLRDHPARQSIAIRENTSWSCHHGILRWMGICPCTPHAEWKIPLRTALDQVAEVVDEQYLRVVGPLIPDPWQLRHQYIHVRHGEISTPDLIQSLAGKRLDEDTIARISILLEAQYERQRMFTSCGWYFDDFDRIEPRNNVAYAAQAVRLTYQATGVDLTPRVLPWLSPIKSWRSGLRADVVYSHFLDRARKN